MSSKKLTVTVDPTLTERITIAESDKILVWRRAGNGNMIRLHEAKADQPTTEREDLLVEIIERMAETLKRGEL